MGSTTKVRLLESREGSSALSSDSQPYERRAAIRCCLRKASTARSASVTGSPLGFRNVLYWPPKKPRAISPALRTASIRRSLSVSGTGDRHAVYPHGWRIGAVAEDEI